MVKIGIIGFGFVGQAVYASIAREDTEIKVFDKYDKHRDSFESITKCQFVFVCVPTPMKDRVQNTSELNEVLNFLLKEDFNGTCIIKSTVVFSEFSRFTDNLNIVYNPEFLNQNTAVDDFRQQETVILGGDAINCSQVVKMYEDHFMICSEYEIMTIEEAVNFKYIHNAYHAYNVLFWNYVHETTGNSRKYVGLYEKMYNRKPIMSQIAPDGKLGYGGACFPKDVAALNWSNPHSLTEFMIEYNNKLRPDE